MQNNNEICIIWKTGVSRDYTVHIGRLSSYASFFWLLCLMIRLLSQLHLCLCLLSASSYMLITISPAQRETDIYAKLRMYQHEGISEAEVPTQRSGHNKGSKITIFFSWLIKILEQWREFTCKYVFTKTVNWGPRQHWSQYKIKTIFKKSISHLAYFESKIAKEMICFVCWI